jgi:hypothetical protein
MYGPAPLLGVDDALSRIVDVPPRERVVVEPPTASKVLDPSRCATAK